MGRGSDQARANVLYGSRQARPARPTRIISDDDIRRYVRLLSSRLPAFDRPEGAWALFQPEVRFLLPGAYLSNEHLNYQLHVIVAGAHHNSPSDELRFALAEEIRHKEHPYGSKELNSICSGPDAVKTPESLDQVLALHDERAEWVWRNWFHGQDERPAPAPTRDEVIAHLDDLYRHPTKVAKIQRGQ